MGVGGMGRVAKLTRVGSGWEDRGPHPAIPAHSSQTKSRPLRRTALAGPGAFAGWFGHQLLIISAPEGRFAGKRLDFDIQEAGKEINHQFG